MKKLIFLLAAAACAKPAGGPLKYTFPNEKIATVPLDKKEGVTQAQQQQDLAQAKHTRASDDFRDSEVEVELAQFQSEHAVLVSQLVAARLGSVTNNPDTAALARKASAAKIAFTEARQAWLDKLALSTFYDFYAAQAKLELERAKVAQANNLAPAGFDISVYETQAQERAKAAQDANARTDLEHSAAEAKLSAWMDAEHAFLSAAGFKGPAESDRAKADWTQPAATPATPAAPAAAPTPAATPAPASATI